MADVRVAPNVVVSDGTTLSQLMSVDSAGRLTVQGGAAADAAVAGNPLYVGGRSSSAIPTAVTADGEAVGLWLDRTGAVTNNGRDAHDAAIDSLTKPIIGGGRASDAVPTAVSADGDAVWPWFDRRGARKTVIVDDAGDSAMDGANNALRVNIVAGAAGGVSHVDDAAFAPTTDDGVPMFAFADEAATDPVDEGDAGIVRMDVNRRLLVRIVGATDANRMDIDASGRPTVNVNGTVTVDSELPAAAALSDTFANPTAPGVGAFLMGWNPTDGDWERVRVADDTGRLQVDVVTGGGAESPTNPVDNYDTSASIAAGSTDNHDTTDLGGTTKKLRMVHASASVPMKCEVQSVSNGTPTTLGVFFTPAGAGYTWNPPHRNYHSVAFSANAGFDGFRVVRTNLDPSEAADVYSNIFYED